MATDGQQKAANQGEGGIMKGKREMCFQEGRSSEICQILLRGDADAD